MSYSVLMQLSSFGASWGPIPWLYPPEILPLSIRAKGASLSTATNWAFNWLVGEVTPVLQAAIKWRLYLVHAFFCACSFVLGEPHIPGPTLHDSLMGTFGSILPLPRNERCTSGRHERPLWRCDDCYANTRDTS